MAIEGFDYKGFAQNLAQQAFELIPPEFNENQRNYIANTLLNFSTIAGEALYNDDALGFNLDQAIMVTQIIAEWSFHKSVDLIRSGIPQQYWDPIMQKIAFTIFEIAKNAFKQNLPQDQCLQLIEHHVKKTWLDCLTELKDKNLIDQGLMEQASNQSNIDAMVQSQEEPQVQEELTTQNTNTEKVQPEVLNSDQPLGADAKVLKLATLAMLFKKMKQDKVQTYLDRFNQNDAQDVIKFMGMPDLENKIGTRNALKCLKEIKSHIPKNSQTINPNKIMTKIQNIAQYMDKSQLELNLRLERNKVKRFVFTALEGEYYNLPPKVANIIATHLEDSV